MPILNPDSQGPSEKRRKYSADLERLGSKRETILQDYEWIERIINSSQRQLQKIRRELRKSPSEEDRIRLSQEKSVLEDAIEIKNWELQWLRKALYKLSSEIDRVHAQHQESTWIASEWNTSEATRLRWMFEWQVESLQREMENNQSIWGWRDATRATRLSVDDVSEYTTFSR